ncbi:MAG: hypothetical protein HXX16_00425 [Bacteroidales bacterium]|nr:hypothetical protein [Bacteroidales bacterium]
MNLESYIKENRNSLDIEKPDEEYLWKGIINVGKKSKHILLFRIVAAASILLILTFTFTYFFNREDKQTLLFANINPSLANQEIRLTGQIEAYSKLIKQSSYDASQVVTGSREIQYINDLINYYSKDLKQNGPNPKLVNSLMDLYQKKVMLLERMLNEIEKSKDHEQHKINI